MKPINLFTLLALAGRALSAALSSPDITRSLPHPLTDLGEVPEQYQAVVDALKEIYAANGATGDAAPSPDDVPEKYQGVVKTLLAAYEASQVQAAGPSGEVLAAGMPAKQSFWHFVLHFILHAILFGLEIGVDVLREKEEAAADAPRLGPKGDGFPEWRR